jgi:O-antigen biosynthesis protein
VLQATTTLQTEIFVVDNVSTDGSITYLQQQFAQVQFIQNPKNIGFGAANNIALQKSKGQYIALVNPDTIVQENTFTACIEHIQHHKNCGAVGVKMIDGSGNFLPESKRAFPSLRASFFKLTGLANVFKTSALFNEYALGHLHQNQTHAVPVLAGAFMLFTKQLYNTVGGFDEDFFMYGEDVDLSYRIQQAGFTNYYIANTSIIHFKGESTQRVSYSYVHRFYKAMQLFVQKHYGTAYKKSLIALIQLAIIVKAISSFLQSYLLKLGMPFLDAVLIFGSYTLVENFWVQQFRNGLPFNQTALPLYTGIFSLVYVCIAAIMGLYYQWYKPIKVWLACIAGTIAVLAMYSLLPEQERFSRGVIIYGSILAAFLISVFKWLLKKVNWLNTVYESDKANETIVIANTEGFEQIQNIYTKAGVQNRIAGYINTENKTNANSLGQLQQLPTIVQQVGAKELVIHIGSLSAQKAIELLTSIPKKISVRFSFKNSLSVVGSKYKVTAGDAIATDGLFQLAHPYQLQMKRLNDVFIAIVLLLSLPVQLLFYKKYTWLLFNCWSILLGKKTWVGYATNNHILPPLPQAVITCNAIANKQSTAENTALINIIQTNYATNFKWYNDWLIIGKYYFSTE